MKRVLALVLALVMVLAPMSAFASTSNDVSRVPKVADDKEFSQSNAPVLRIEEDRVGDFQDGDSFRLKLEGAGAEWNYSEGDTVTAAVYEGAVAIGDVEFVREISSSIFDVKIDYSGYAARNRTTEALMSIPMNVTLDGTGEAKVVIDSRGTGISSGTYTYAVASGGETVATVSDSETVQRKSNERGANIIIDETNVAALGAGTQKFRLKLPSDFEWGSDMEDKTGAVYDNVISSHNSITVTSVDADGRNLDIQLNVTNPTSLDILRTLTIKTHIDVTRDADYGDVTVRIDGQNSDISDESELLIAEYKTYDVEVSIDEVKEFFAGRLNDDDNLYTAKIKIKENIKGSLLPGRTIELSLPDWVKIVDEDDNGLFDDITIGNESGINLSQSDIKVNSSGNEIDIDVPKGYTGSSKTEWTLKLPITAKANEAGDVKLTVDGAGIEETELVIAEVIAPIEAEIEMTDVRIGVQGQSAPDIIIKETKKGALREDADLLVWFKDEFGFSFDDAEYDVIEGDLEIDQKNSEITGDGDRTIKIRIDSESSKPSTIKISNIKLTLDRTVPEGPFAIRVGGDAVVENFTDKDDHSFFNTSNLDYDKDYYKDDFTSRVLQADFANVVTRAGGVVASEAKFVIGEATYNVLVNGKNVEKVMDTAAFIENGRTMLPVRYVAEALGVSEDNIVWNGEARTVTVFKDARVVQLTIDNDVMMVNGVAVQMDSAAIIRGGRTFLPVRFVAQALNADIQWDASTRTVTINQ